MLHEIRTGDISCFVAKLMAILVPLHVLFLLISCTYGFFDVNFDAGLSSLPGFYLISLLVNIPLICIAFGHISTNRPAWY